MPEHSIRARAGGARHTVKVTAEGIYDMSGVDPRPICSVPTKRPVGMRRLPFVRPRHARTILVGVDPRYRAAMARQGFKWAENHQAAEAGLINDSTADALQKTQLVSC